jgi:sulfoxide reductase heme-binding subunit YedZ
MRAGKHDFAEVALYGAIVSALLGWRLLRFLREKSLLPVPVMPSQLSKQ